jgi:hypothetical protein
MVLYKHGRPCVIRTLISEGTKMKTVNINVIALAIALAFSTSAIAESTSKVDYNAAKDKMAAEYKLAKAGCDSLAGNAKDICVKEAKAAEIAAMGDGKTRMKTSDANATANEKRDTYPGSTKDGCLNQAKVSFGK